MDIMGLFPTIACIVVICFFIGEVVKCFPISTKFVPVIVAICGGGLGIIGWSIGIPELAALTILDAIASGICSGITSSGAYSLIKNITGHYSNNELTAKEQKELTK